MSYFRKWSKTEIRLQICVYYFNFCKKCVKNLFKTCKKCVFRRKIMDKERKSYKKLHREHKREIVRLAKKDADYDWSFLHNLVCRKIKNMAEFYEKGFGVAQEENSRKETLASLEGAIKIIDRIDHCWDEYRRSVIGRVGTENLIDLELIDEERWLATKASEEEAVLYKQLYEYIGEHLREWWD